MPLNRRHFISSVTGVVVAAPFANVMGVPPSNIACNQYNWITFYARDGKTWFQDPDASLAEFAQSGIVGYEPAFNKVEEVQQIAPLLQKYKLEMKSIYVGSELHKAEASEKSIESILAIAEAAKPLGTRMIVSNPSPIRWGSTDNKNDAELTIQAQNLDKIGAELRRRGMVLAYHNHDPELRAAAREFHHMMLATNPKNVSLCLDVHWCYRGAENSQIALFDLIKLYGKRIVELHLRQSKNGIWEEVFGEGDIDYRRVAKELKTIGIKPHLVLEQCLEKGSPNTTSAVEAHRRGLAYVKEVFGG